MRVPVRILWHIRDGRNWKSIQAHPETSSLREDMFRGVGTPAFLTQPVPLILLKEFGGTIPLCGKSRGAVPHRLGSPSDIPGAPASRGDHSQCSGESPVPEVAYGVYSTYFNRPTNHEAPVEIIY
jgi:hypothetical protein